MNSGIRIGSCLLLAACLCSKLVGETSAQDLRAGAGNPLTPPAVASSQLPSSLEEIEARLVKAETQLRTVRAAQGDPPTAEATADERSERDRLYMQWAIALDSQARSFRRLKERRRLNEEHVSEAQNWHGFSETPPYSVVDRLLNDIEEQQLKLDSDQIVLSISTGGISRGSALLEDARRSLRLVQDEIDALSQADPRHAWLLRLAQTRVQAHEATIQASDLERLVILEALTGQRDYLAFLSRKLALARGQTHFTQADFEAGQVRIRALKDQAQQELHAAILADADLVRAFAVARENLQQAQTNSTPTAPLRDLRTAFAAAKARSETSQFKVELLRNLLLLGDYAQTLWQDRFWAAQDHSLSELRNKRAFYHESLGTLDPWKDFFSQNLSAAAAEALRQGVAAGDANLSAVEHDSATQIQAALEERAMLYQRGLASLALIENANRRLISEIIEKESRVSFAGRLRLVADTTISVTKSIWNSELYVAEDSILSDGRKISIARSITVGKVIIALIILVAGLVVARLGYEMAKRSTLGWLKFEERTATLFGQTMGTVLALIALFVAMAAVRIPWTVFAFVGGALAIGVGFGAQTLINNFISGLILLFERSIRVGDIVEVDEQRGKIARIGIRNSLLQRGDGIEILVPNSRFLEKYVVNWTLSNTLVRYSITVGVAYGSPTRKVAELMAQVAAGHQAVLLHPAPTVLFEEFGDNALQFTLNFWMHLSENVDGGTVRSELRHGLNAAFEQAGIVLAFPQRDVHLDVTQPLEIKVLNPTPAVAPVTRDHGSAGQDAQPPPGAGAL